MAQYTQDQKDNALQAAHDVVCELLGLNPEVDSSPAAYNGPCGIEPWVESLWSDESITRMVGADSDITPTNL